jgi:hypothetical protein
MVHVLLDVGKIYQISKERQQMYYIGNGISIFGLLLFLSTFFMSTKPANVTFPANSALLNFEETSKQMNRMHSEASSQMNAIMARSIIGILFMLGGQVVARAGKRGLAGSGIILDPVQARKDVEPWSRMAGGVVNDVIEEIKPIFQPKASIENQENQAQRPASERLKELESLRDQGMLTGTEYEAKRREIIESI